MKNMGQAKAAPRKRRAGRPRARAPRPVLSREDWICAARADLVAGGVNAVKVDRLARRLGVTRGSFYWHFKSHADLLRELLKSWEQTNTGPFERVLGGDEMPRGVREFVAIIKLWVEEKDYSPAFDTAVRDWARTSREAAAAVHRADGRRIEILHRVFIDIGFVDPEALIRARIAYFHQVGYYTLEFRESREERLALVPLYARVLLGGASEMIDAAFAETDITAQVAGQPTKASASSANDSPAPVPAKRRPR
jgi:AcrR family transcriptional regulator